MQLHEMWHALARGEGHDAQAAEWRRKFEAGEREMQKASEKPAEKRN